MAEGRIEILVIPDLSQFPADLRSGLAGAGETASTAGLAIGAAIAAGTAIAAVGFKQAIDLGIEFEANLNSLQAVSRATDLQMSAVSATATRLGSDLSLPATSAADAAEAMLELAKGGLTVDQAMAAAKGTLQLAAAAQITGAEAATIQSAALNSFGLEAGQAGRVADVLANSANAASGEITEFADAMQQVGAVANQFGISIEDTSTALSLFANAGIRGSDAGTLLKSALLALANPSKPAQKAMEELSLTAFDATGNFVGLESIFGQLREASGRLTTEQYTQAAATVFGSDAVRLAGVAAGTTGEQWDTMALAVGRAGGAQEVAAAKTKGLGGAIEGLNSQLETAQLQVFDAISEPLEQGVRAATELVPRIGESVASGLRIVVAVGRTVGPDLAAGIRAGGAEVVSAGRDLVEPLSNAVGVGLIRAFETGAALAGNYVGVLDNVVDGLTPVAEGLGSVADAAVDSDGALSAVGTTLAVAGGAVQFLSMVLVPIGGLVGGLVSGFGSLPGPIQSVVLAMLALRFAGPLMAGLSGAARGLVNNTGILGRSIGALASPVTGFASGLRQGATAADSANGSFGRVGTAAQGAGQRFGAAALGARQFGQEMRVQQSLAAAGGQSIGRLAAAQAAFQTSSVGAVAAARGFTQQVTGIRAAAAGAGAPIGSMAAAMAAVGQRVPLIGQMGAAFSTAATNATRFGTAAGTAAAAATGLRGVGAGLIGALGGPFGAAITAAVIGLGLLGAANRRARQEEQEHAATVGSLADALKASGGAFNQNAREVLAGTDQFKAAADGAKQFGVGLDELSSAAINGGSEMEALRGKLLAIIEANSNTFADPQSGQLITTYSETGLAAQGLLRDVEGLGAVVEESRVSYAEFAEAVDEAGGSMVNGATSGSTLKSALDVLGTAASTADEKTRALNDALDALSGGQLSLEQAQSKLNESLTGIAPAFEAARAAADGAGVSFLNASGGIDTTTEAGRALLDETAELGQRMTETAQAAFDAAGGFGNLGPATVAAREAAQSSYDAFIQAAQSIGLTAEQAEGLAARYGLIPDTVVTLLTAQGLDQVDQELLQIKARFDAVPGEKKITVQSLTEEAKAQLADVGLVVNELPNGDVEIIAYTEAAKAKFGELTGQIVGTTATFTLDANPAPANNQVNGSVTFANGQTGTITIDGNQQPVNGKITASVQFADGSQGTITLDANPNPATGQVNGVVRYGNGSTSTIQLNARDLVSPVINRLRQNTSSTHTVYVRQDGSVGVSRLREFHDGGIAAAMARGGVLGFDRGGYGSYKGHRLTPMSAGLATLVPPNTWRVIGDRVRDDEAYIPINHSARSLALLEETARRMGRYTVRAFADGGISQQSARALAAVRAQSAEGGALRAELSELRAGILQSVQAARTGRSDAGAVVSELRAQTQTLVQVLRESPATSAAAHRLMGADGAW